MEKISARVLVAPLNWGLGHATRCIPVINELIALNCAIFISASGGGKIILQQLFPGCTFVEIPQTTIKYPENGSMVFSMLRQTPSILKSIRRENYILSKIIDEHNITHVISDNRFGLYSGYAKTAFITHQIKISGGKNFKFLEPLIHRVNKKYIEKFDELWIPDSASPNNLSGKLSVTSGLKIKSHHVGVLSRFKNNSNKSTSKTFDVIALLSGPEPQRTILENKIINHFSNSTLKWLVIQGLPENNMHEKENIISSIDDTKLREVLHPDTLLICRPGYSTIMDVVTMGHNKILFIPTPGQTEQEYLAEYLFRMYGIRYINQHDEIPLDIEKGKLPVVEQNDHLKKVIKDFVTTK